MLWKSGEEGWMKTRCQVLSAVGGLLAIVVPVKFDVKDCGVCGRLGCGVEVELVDGVTFDDAVFAVVGGM